MTIQAQSDVGAVAAVTAVGFAIGLTVCICGMTNRWFVAPWFLLLVIFDCVLGPAMCRESMSQSGRDAVLGGFALLGWNLPSVAAWFVCAWYHRRQLQANRLRQGLCAGCGYNLTGNVSGVCPECGKKT